MGVRGAVCAVDSWGWTLGVACCAGAERRATDLVLGRGSAGADADAVGAVSSALALLAASTGTGSSSSATVGCDSCTAGAFAAGTAGGALFSTVGFAER
jgi:hypothetical protein